MSIGCFDNSVEDRARSRQLNAHLATYHDVSYKVCALCHAVILGDERRATMPSGKVVCQACGDYVEDNYEVKEEAGLLWTD